MDPSVEDRLAALESRLEELASRLERIEPEGPAPPETAAVRVAMMSAAAAAEPAPPEPAPPERTAPETLAPPPADPPRTQSLEELLGGRVLAWIGGLAILTGVVLFLAIAVERGWIGVEARVALAFLGSTLLLGAGLFLYERRGQTDAAIVAVAAALAALYASLTYATAVQDVVGVGAGLAVAALVGAAGATIAVRWNSQFVAALALLGALAAPVLVASDTSSTALAFAVLALIATVAVLIWRRWGWLALGAFLITAPQLAVWAWDRDGLAVQLPLLAAYWSLFVVAAIGYELRVPTASLRVSSASVLLINAGLASALGWSLVDDRGTSSGATAWVLGVTVAHVLLGSLSFRERMSTEIASLLVAVGVGLSGVTLALALDGPALVVGWSAEAAILAWVAARTRELRAVFFSLAFLALAAANALSFDAPPDALVDGVDDLGRALVGVVAVGVAAMLSGRLAKRHDLHDLHLPLFGVAAVAFVYAASLGIVDVIQGDSLEDSQTAQVALSTFWAVLGLGAIVVGLARDVRELRIGGLALLGLGVAKVFAYDLAELDQIYRVLSFIAVGILLLVGAYAYQRVRAVQRA